MKRFQLLPLFFTAVLFCFSCTDDEDMHGGGGDYKLDASFRKVDLTGAQSLVLASNDIKTRAMTRADGDNGADQHTDYNYSAPLYKVSADGKMVEVNYQIEVITSGTSKDDKEVRDSINANLRLKIEYIYGIDDKWLLLYNCCYDYPGYDELPDGSLKASVNRLITDANNIGRYYMVRLEDGALFLLERDQTLPALGKTAKHSQNEVKGAVEMVGKDIYYLDQNPMLTRMTDRGNTLDISHVLNNNVRTNYILRQGSAFGIVPMFQNGNSNIFGLPSVIFPGLDEQVQIEGVTIDDKDVEMFLVDDELYVSRNNGAQLEEIELELGDTYLIVDGQEHQMLFQDSLFGYNYAIYNVPAHAGSKIQIRTSIGMLFVACEFTNFGGGSDQYQWGMLCTPQEIEEHDYYHEFEIPEDGNYEFYLSLIGPDYGGDIQFAKEGWSKTASPSDFNCGRDRYIRGNQAEIFKVEISDKTASLSEQSVLKYFGSAPHFSWNESDFDTRHRRIVTGGVLNWIEENEEHRTVLNRADVRNGNFNSMEINGHFPSRMSEYYDGIAYVPDGNNGYYECSLATAQEKYISIDLSAVRQYRLATQLTNPVFDPSLMEFTMTAFTQDGTQLTVYVDVLGENAGKARVFVTESGGAGMVITSLVRLN